MKERRDVFFAIADENRRAILMKLATEKEPLPISAILSDFSISRTGVAKHLKVLEESGLVTTEFKGRENYISLEANKLAEVHDWVFFFQEFWMDKVHNLKKMIETNHKTKK
ncbi:MAG: metalloregulator ArsR/SmtB family transcription factor [Taibaiella sp.]|nr:metalloregulator ArsR/SmtB family transcription factor [Taibaiella sp.]